MAATAGSVAVGSTIGHGISSMLFGGRSESAPVEQQQQAPAQQNTSSFASNCEGQAKEFSKCLEKADLPSCSWYLEQLKAVSFQSYDSCVGIQRNLCCSARQPLPNTDRSWVGIYFPSPNWDVLPCEDSSYVNRQHPSPLNVSISAI
jgi:coiled-coil-helix-coiled-coil-helix domain-containing protein 2